MKRKSAPPPEAVVPRELLPQAEEPLEARRRRRSGKCTVCGAECSPTSTEQLCWVCRRLKISAWQESEQQMPAQE